MGTLVFLHSNSVGNFLPRMVCFGWDSNKDIENILLLSGVFGTFRFEYILGILVEMVVPWVAAAAAAADKVNGADCTRSTPGRTAGIEAAVVPVIGWAGGSLNLHFPRIHTLGSARMAFWSRGTRKYSFQWALRSARVLLSSGTFLRFHNRVSWGRQLRYQTKNNKR